MKHVKLFEQFLNEAKLDYTVADAAEAAGLSPADMKNEEKVLAKVLKYLGANSLSDLYYAGDNDFDDVSDDWSEDETFNVKGSSLYGDGSGKTTIGLGEIMGIKSVPCASISDGTTTFFIVGPKSIMNFR